MPGQRPADRREIEQYLAPCIVDADHPRCVPGRVNDPVEYARREPGSR